MEIYFINLFDNIHYERCLLLFLSKTGSNILLQSGFTNDETKIIKNIVLQKGKRQIDFEQYIAMDLLEKQFSNL